MWRHAALTNENRQQPALENMKAASSKHSSRWRGAHRANNNALKSALLEAGGGSMASVWRLNGIENSGRRYRHRRWRVARLLRALGGGASSAQAASKAEEKNQRNGSRIGDERK